jgi:hypothetical protein
MGIPMAAKADSGLNHTPLKSLSSVAVRFTALNASAPA